MQTNKEKGLKKFNGLLSSLLMVCLLVTGLGVTAYGYDKYYILTQVGYISIGQSKQLDTFISEFGHSVTWESLDPDIVAVTNEGVITGISKGRGYVMASSTEVIPEVDSVEVFEVNVVPVGVTQVSSGQSHILVLKNDGTLWGWGHNVHGQLATTPAMGIYEPIKIMENVAYVSAGWGHSLAITKDGTLYAWGYNMDGQVGNGTTSAKQVTQVPIMNNVQAVYADGAFHTLALKDDGTLWAWGQNSHGEIGNGTVTNSVKYPVKVMDNVVHAGVGSGHSMAVRREESGEYVMYAWGANYGSRLGVGLDDMYVTTPTRVEGLTGNVVNMSGGTGSTMAITKGNSLWGWGSNEYGQIGNNAISKTPVQEPYNIMNNVVHVSQGQTHTLAIDNNGALYVWGNNERGQIGNGTIGGTQNTPVRIMENVKFAVGGMSHSVAVTKNGEIYVWGDNYTNQLALGNDVSYSPIPIRVNFTI